MLLHRSRRPWCDYIQTFVSPIQVWDASPFITGTSEVSIESIVG